MGLIAAIGYVGEQGGDGGFIKDIWTALKVSSPPVAMVLFALLLDERRERREAQRQCNERTVDYIKSTNLQTTASEKMATGFRQLTDAVRGALDARRRRR